MSANSEARTIDHQDLADLASLDARVDSLLPPQYQSCFESVNPRSMGSASLKYGADARVAWDQIWTHFCDLAIAGGPPHRGSLLEAPTPDEVAAEPAGYQFVRDEIIRGLRMTTGLVARETPVPGWVAIPCSNAGMAAWLLRAVMSENVFVRRSGDMLLAPAGPTFRLAKEVKNVVVAFAKTCHYWQSHFSNEQRASASRALADKTDLLEPPDRAQILSRAAEYEAVTQQLEQTLAQTLGLPIVHSKNGGWVGLRFHDERTAAWFVRSAIAVNILARREENVLYLPTPILSNDRPANFDVVQRAAKLQRLWAMRGGK